MHVRQYGVRGIVIMWKDEVGMSVGCLMLIIIEEIKEIQKWCVDRVIAEMIIGVTTRMAVKEISGSKAGIDFRRMIEDLMIGNTSLEMEVQRMMNNRNRGTSENFSRGDRRQRGRLNVLKVNDVQSDQTQ
ncbi:uncharacterized protein TNCV_4372161 [Trichonephila clavipes]|nr:uncharacterized protein TNCV_4372161 [Trichonephila clavipes]